MTIAAFAEPTNQRFSFLLLFVIAPSIVASLSFSQRVLADTVTYSTPGTYSFTVPAYSTMTVEVWGAGGGGGGMFYNNCTAGGSGGQSSWDAVVIAYGGGGGSKGCPSSTQGAGGAGGAAAGGTTNTTGGAGGAGTFYLGGTGGAGANGGAGGTNSGANPSAGTNGTAPGGGGGGGYAFANTGGGGGGGGYSAKTYASGAYAAGQTVTVIVGSGGTAGTANGSPWGGSGAAGQVTITYTSVSAPTLSTSAASSVTSSSGTLNGSITATGGANATQSGFAYSITANLTSGVSTTTLGAQTGTASFSSSVSSLSANTTYYFRAYATNSAGTGYGSIQSFTTAAIAPTLTTDAASSITSSSATLNANITATGGANAIARGFARATNAAMTAGVSTSTEAGSFSTGTFSSTTSGLAAGTTYYVRAYATNSAGTSYGSVASFTTIALPTLATNAATNVSTSTATLNGNVTATGGQTGAGTAQGFAYGTNSSLSGGDTATSSNGTYAGAGAFTRALTGLTPGTTYYFRAYAANAAGTSTGSIFSFSTPSAATVVTNAAANVATSTATLNGYLTNTGGLTGAGTSYGFAYGTSTSLTGSNVATTSLGTYSGTGSFSLNITGLEQGATYYFRAFAANSAGTSTGGVISFTTQTRPTVVTNAASAVNVFSATLNGNITSTGGDNATVRGFAYGTNSSLTSGVSTTTASGSFGTGAFTYDLSGLTAGTTYYYRSYATNPQGISYGSIISVTTLADTLTLDTQAVTNITHGIATFSANITAARAGLQRGFAYSTSASLSSGVSTSTLGTYTGSGSMQETVIGLNADTTYYVRAYATKSDSTSYGNVVSFTTQKNRTGGTSINAAAVGAGIVSGGDSGGTGGDEIGSEIDFYAPANVTAISGGGLTGASSGYASDGAYATAAASAASNYHTFGFNIPASDSITGIAVKLEVSASSAAGTFGVELSWDGGSTMTQTGRTTPTLTTSDAVHLLGGASDAWGRSWVPSEFNSGNFRVRVTGSPSSNTVRLDALQVRVYHQATGGSGGGGGEI